MLKWIPILGPWACSVVEDEAGRRVLAQLQATLVTAAAFALLITAVALASSALGLEHPGAWLVDFVVVIYVIEGLLGTISALRLFASWDEHLLVRITGATLLGAVQGIAIPLLGLFLAYATIASLRTLLAISVGGGFFGWLWGIVV